MNYLVHHLLQSSARRLPAKEALVHEDIRISYAEIDKYTNRLANGLLSADLKRGDRIGIFLDHSIQQVLSIYGISKAGAVFVPINPLLFPDQVRHIVNHSCPKTGLE